MTITLDRTSDLPLYQQISEQIEGMIRSGELLPGDVLPPERRLAGQLKVNRTTVLSAYRELKDRRLVGSHVGRGTVALDAPREDVSGKEPEPEWSHFLSAHAGRIGPQAVGQLLSLAGREDMISFAAGIAAYSEGPLDALRDVTARLLQDRPEQCFMLSPVEGFYSLRHALAGEMSARGCAVDPEEIMVLSGSQQGIDLCARTLIDPGDVVVVEEPTYFPALQIFRALGARVIGAATDEGGIRIDSMEELLGRHRPKLIYTMPSFHNPTGRSMSVARRNQLVALSQRHKVLLLEDDAYGSFNYGGAAHAPLKSLDTSGHVIYLSTFTKMICPGIRLGWLAAAPKLLRRITAARQLQDVHPNSLSQRIVEEMLKDGQLGRHMDAVRVRYQERRDRMLAALEEYAAPGMCWSKPEGGYYIWCGLPQGISAGRLLDLASRRGVAFVPGTQFYPGEGGEGQLRLNFTYAPLEDLRRGILILCESVRELLAEQSPMQAPLREITPIL